MSFSPQQDAAIKAVRDWLRNPSGKQIFRLFGYAGTGKTTLAKELAGTVKGTVLFATFTGKASLVLAKGCADASTIHSLIYRVEVDERTGQPSFVLNSESDLADAELLIVDEVSMVGADLAEDLLSFGKRVLVLGDPAQLPPVKDEGFFINQAPDMMLTEVHRQAADNPIIRMSMDIREGKRLLPGQYGDSIVASRALMDPALLRQHVLDCDQVLCGLNRTRTSYNRRIRALKGLAGKNETHLPAKGDRLICLRNNRDKHLFNGGIWTAASVDDAFGALRIIARSDDEDRAPVPLVVPEAFFTGEEPTLDWQTRRKFDEFTFGWAITCHKSQGSSWPHVVVFDESGAFREARSNWIYTAITRASDRVTVIV